MPRMSSRLGRGAYPAWRQRRRSALGSLGRVTPHRVSAIPSRWGVRLQPFWCHCLKLILAPHDEQFRAREYAGQERLAGAALTPYDGDPTMRAVYLNYYW